MRKRFRIAGGFGIPAFGVGLLLAIFDWQDWDMPPAVVIGLLLLAVGSIAIGAVLAIWEMAEWIRGGENNTRVSLERLAPLAEEAVRIDEEMPPGIFYVHPTIDDPQNDPKWLAHQRAWSEFEAKRAQHHAVVREFLAAECPEFLVDWDGTPTGERLHVLREIADRLRARL